MTPKPTFNKKPQAKKPLSLKAVSTGNAPQAFNRKPKTKEISCFFNSLLKSKWMGFFLKPALSLSKKQIEHSPHKPIKKHKSFGFTLLGNKGQGLIEYLILVALMGVATIGIIRTLNQTVKSRFANAIYALQGRNQKAKTHSLKKEEYQRSDLSNFMSGSASSDKKEKKKKK